jgi:hypothetical protein
VATGSAAPVAVATPGAEVAADAVPAGTPTAAAPTPATAAAPSRPRRLNAAEKREESWVMRASVLAVCGIRVPIG